MHGHESNRAAAAARVAWPGFCRPSLRHAPSVRGRKLSPPNPPTSVAAGGAAVEGAAVREAVSRWRHQARPARNRASGRRGRAARAGPSADVIRDAPSAPARPPSGTEMPGRRRREMSIAGRREGSRSAGGAEVEGAAAGRDPEGRPIRADRRTRAGVRRRADPRRSPELAGIEWTSEALA